MLITIREGKTIIDVSKKPAVMGIINCTPDSFYQGSRAETVETAVAAARKMIRDGADILDIGGESTRPGSDSVDAGEESLRVLPVIREIRKESDIPVSIDTRKRSVAEKALDAGADIINDVSALSDDPEMAALASERAVPVVLMHKRGDPKTMQRSPSYADVTGEVCAELQARITFSLESGIRREQIIIDPGIGFGKRLEDNLILLKQLPKLVALGYAVLVGASRKSSIGAVLGVGNEPRKTEERLSGTLAAHIWSLIQGVHIIRVHDVSEHADAVKVLTAIRNS